MFASDLYLEVPWCAAVAGQGNAKHWYLAQVAAWICLCQCALLGAYWWQSHWGGSHDKEGVTLGAAKTCGFAIVDVMCISVLGHGRRAFNQLEEWRRKASRNPDKPCTPTWELGIGEQICLTSEEEA
eukprot:6100782-Amphidinium_carterae.1